MARARTSSNVDARAVAQAALGGAAGKVVLDAVAGEDPRYAVVHLDGEVDGEFALALAENDAHVVIESEAVSGGVELRECGLEGAPSGLGLWLTNDHNRLEDNYSENEKGRAIGPPFAVCRSFRRARRPPLREPSFLRLRQRSPGRARRRARSRRRRFQRRYPPSDRDRSPRSRRRSSHRRGRRRGPRRVRPRRAEAERQHHLRDVQRLFDHDLSACRDELADDHVLLETEQLVDLAADSGLGQDSRGLLEGGGGEEALSVQRGLGDPEQDGLRGRGLAALGQHASVLGLEPEAVDAARRAAGSSRRERRRGRAAASGGR